MFVVQRIDLACSFDDVVAALRNPSSSLATMVGGAYRSGEDLSIRIGIGGDPPRVAKTVSVVVDEPSLEGDRLVVPMRWRAAGPLGVLYPRMEADLVARPVPEGTMLVFRGRYRPPADAVGELVDGAALHRIAEATVANFLERVAQALADTIGSEVEGPSSSPDH